MTSGVYSRRPVADRFWAKVDKAGDCWLWQGGTDPKGYGSFWDGTKHMKAHRWSFEAENGPIGEGLFVLHRCDTPPCVRPEHLWLGTNLDNVRDMIAKGRQGQPSPQPRWVELGCPRCADIPNNILGEVRAHLQGEGECSYLSTLPPCHLSPIEKRIYRFLASRAGDIVPAWHIANTADCTPNAVRVHITRLRRKLVPLGFELNAVREHGYCLRPIATQVS